MSTARPTGIVRRLWRETPHLTGVVLEVSPELAAQYTRPGQVVVLRPNDTDQIYLALASSPGEVQALELLIGEAAMAKAKLEQGGQVHLDPPSGPGFKLEMATGRDVLLFAVGSGLAPVRPLIQHLRKNRSDYGQIILYVGAHTEQDFPYQAEYEGWKRDRIDVVRSISKPWVQDRFREEAPDVRNAVAYLVGMKAMIEGVTAALVEAGLDKERIGKNW
ncbi:MAG: hypothetical protein IPG45_12950 [Deltaproteobacteria bacterium]|nr:hypothetical protein [Deltaproteobacteria bacterium]